MDRPVEVTFRNTVSDPEVEAVVRREAAKLERYHRPIVGCRVAIERPQRFQRNGNVYRVRLFITAGTRRPIVVSRDPRDSDMHDDLRTIVLGAFKAARRQLQSMTQQQRGEEKSPQPPPDGRTALEPPLGWQDAGSGTRRGRRRSKRGAPR